MIRLVPCKAHEIPVELLKQKDMWDLRIFYERALLCVDWHAFLVEKDDVAIAAFIIDSNTVYSDAHCSTMIIDSDHRSEETQRIVYNMARDAAHAIARALGLRSISFGTFRPNFVLELLEDSPDHVKRSKPRVVEYILREEVWPE